MTAVRTVLGDIAPREAGRVYAHEHLVLDSPLIAAAFAHIHLDDVEIAMREVTSCAAAGVGMMVDAMPCAAGRSARRLAAISRQTGVHVVAVTGLHHLRYYGEGHWSAGISEARLADLFVADIEEGIDAHDYTGPVVQRTPYRAGLIKIATGGETLTRRDRHLMAAAARAHLATGAPIITHCEQGRGALEQVAELESLGVDPSAVLLSHVDKHPDDAYHRDIAQTGAWLLYDQALRQADHPEPQTVRLLSMLASHNLTGRVLLGTDGARRDLWTEYDGSPGLAWLASGLPPLLRAAGLDQETIDTLYLTNPQAALALRTP